MFICLSLSCTRIYYQAVHHTISANRTVRVPSRAVANASTYLFPRIRHHCSGKYRYVAFSFCTFLSCSFNCRILCLFLARQADGQRQPLSSSVLSGLSLHVSHLRIPYAVFGITYPPLNNSTDNTEENYYLSVPIAF